MNRAIVESSQPLYYLRIRFSCSVLYKEKDRIRLKALSRQVTVRDRASGESVSSRAGSLQDQNAAMFVSGPLAFAVHYRRTHWTSLIGSTSVQTVQ